MYLKAQNKKKEMKMDCSMAQRLYRFLEGKKN